MFLFGRAIYLGNGAFQFSPKKREKALVFEYSEIKEVLAKELFDLPNFSNRASLTMKHRECSCLWSQEFHPHQKSFAAFDSNDIRGHGSARRC